MKKSVLKALRGLGKALPMILGTVLLVSLVSTLIPKSFYITIFSKNIFLDSFIGSFIGSISVGNPVVSYVFGGEMLNQGVSLVAVSAFLVAWASVGIVQLPVESAIFGRRFAFFRNISAFILAIVAAMLSVFIYNFI